MCFFILHLNFTAAVRWQGVPQRGGEAAGINFPKSSKCQKFRVKVQE